MRPLHYIIRRPLLSEKVTSQADRKVVAFEVARDANKVEVKQALEKAFDIKVQDVKTLVVAGKIKRTGRNFGKRSNWKKAYITLTPESNMDFFGV